MWEERGRERSEGEVRSRRARRQGTHNSGDQAGEGSREPREADVQVLQQQHEEKEGEAGCHGRAGQARGEGQVCLACERRRETERRGAGKEQGRWRREGEESRCSSSEENRRGSGGRVRGRGRRTRGQDTRAGHEVQEDRREVQRREGAGSRGKVHEEEGGRSHEEHCA